MTPEETFNQEVWFVLQRLKEEGLAAGGNTFIYETTHSVFASGVPTADRKRQIIINKLAKETGAVEIVREIEPGYGNFRSGFILRINQPAFDVVYEHYQQICEPQAYQNTYQVAISRLSPKAKNRILGVVNRLVDESELAPVNEPFTFNPATYIGSDNDYNEWTIIAKLEEWGILQSEREDIGGSLLITTTTDKLQKIQKLLEQNGSHQTTAGQSAPTSIPPSSQTAVEEKPEWQDDFKWEGNTFRFGQYGEVTFSSEDRKTMYVKLTDQKGKWTTISTLRGRKNPNYVRATISQIEKLFSPELKRYVSIPSTKDDPLEPKPASGAYRIKFVSKPE